MVGGAVEQGAGIVSPRVVWELRLRVVTIERPIA